MILALFFVVFAESLILITFSILVLTKKQKKETIPIRSSSKSVLKSPPAPIPTVTPMPSPTVTKPSVKEVEAQTISLYISKINDYRILNGLSPLKEDQTVCLFANTRANEISSSFTHDGFSNRVSSRTLPYKTYSNIVENIAQEPNHSSVISLWINSAPHAQNLKADISYGCVGESGDYFAFEGWKPL